MLAEVDVLAKKGDDVDLYEVIATELNNCTSKVSSVAYRRGKDYYGNLVPLL